MKNLTVLSLVLLFTCTILSLPLRAQNLEKEAKALTKKYVKAYNKEDVSTLASMYTDDAVRTYSDGRKYSGIAEITAAMEAEFAANALTLSIEHGSSEMNADGTATVKGTYQLVGNSNGQPVSLSGSYNNTMTKVGKKWLLTSSTIMVDN
ncbi:nuclear transport factor 2 family protein [Algoriphagus lutimaris]|uniref:YybH family protein n=1 Tax=Algoriphagus lutimaris TaxID=613197 RepID=UPI00196B5A28|nr:nuclear transport factor 2 family protein [Algoriphagus lutimaris]MBN3519100.1 nuclear transport factor 2 family protein [Algoriphagus lutimaris]